MNAHPPDPLDDRLEAAIAALRRSPAPDGPSKATLARTLAALTAAESVSTITPQRWRTLMLTTLKVSAAAALLAAAALSIIPFRPAMAFADLAQKLREAHTLTLRSTVEMPGSKKLVQKYYFKDPGRVRIDSSNGQLAIMDTTTGKSLFLFPDDKTARVVQSPVGPARPKRVEAPASQIIAMLRGARDKDVRPVEGRKQIGEIEAQGFRIVENGQEITVWADPKTKLPLLAEATVEVNGGKALISMSDFTIGPDLDDALFETVPPKGYEVEKSQEQEFIPEEDVVRLLRHYASHADGAFPPRIDNSAAYKPEWIPYKMVGGAATFDPEATRLLGAIGRSTVLRFVIKDGFGYKPDGAKLGDADKIVFWYRPEGAATYRAVFGDLHVANVPADRLPEKPKP